MGRCTTTSLRVGSGLVLAALLLAGCGGNRDPNAKRATELSSAQADSAPGHAMSDPAALKAETTADGPGPSFTGVWALAAQDCAVPAKTYQFSAKRIDMGPQRGCAVTAIKPLQRAPASRYEVEGACIGPKRAENSAFVFAFGDGGELELTVDTEAPVKLHRCASP